MELSNDMLIDLGLNLAGFLAAAGLMLVSRSIFTRPRKKAETTGSAAAATLSKEQPNRIGLPNRPLEVISFNNEDATNQNGTTEQRRNRAQVIQLARQMIATGIPTDKIRSQLPLSEAELAVLSYER